MYYVALVWDDHDVVKDRTARTMIHRLQRNSPLWELAIDRPGLVVLCKPRPNCRAEEIYRLAGDRGVVLGKLFSGANAVGRLEDTISRQIATNGGEPLIEKFWGRYVAFIQDAEQGKRWVLRDPSGTMPCQWTCLQGIDVYFMRIEDCEKLSSPTLSFNRNFFVGYLLNAGTAVRQTPFQEVESVMPGERIEHHSGRRNSAFLWNPIEISQRDPIEDFDEAVRLARQTVRTCLDAWTSCFDRILLSLSGGLDSSIVSACVKAATSRPGLLARHFHAVDSPMDERRFARLVASHLGLRLVEKERTAEYGPLALHFRALSLFPGAWPVDPEQRAEESQFFECEGLQVEFRGHGGDELFFQNGAFATAVDYCWHRRLDRHALNLCLDDAAFMRTSLWRVLKQVFRFGIRRESWHMSDMERPRVHSLLMPELIQQKAIRRDQWHPLFGEPASIPPGKYLQAFQLAFGACKFYEPLLSDEYPLRFSPMFSQPLLELCLRIPLYVLRDDGQDRAVARTAFADVLPPQIVSRQSKAYGTHRYREIVFRNLDFIRGMLLDGVLVREGILDRTVTENALSSKVSRIPAQVVEILSYMGIENWARAWQERGYLAPLNGAFDTESVDLGTPSRAAAS